ncbi:MAG TPA: helix-turn-helix domain-containing protein [Stellaceae bacterium]|nr:helix-turn-helix domain-containing protein [Stellaceae bacterium]
MPKLLSTTDLHPRDRLDYWVDELSRNVTAVGCEPVRGQPFFGEIRSDAIGCIGGMTYSSIAQTFGQRRPADFFTLGVQLEGHGFASGAGRDVELHPGELMLYDASRPFRLTFGGRFVRTTLRFPREALVQRVGNAEHFIGRSIDGSIGAAGILSPLLRDLPSRAGVIPAAARERVADNLLDLIATVLLADIGQPPRGAGMTLVHAKAWIEMHLAEPLTAEQIAGACRLSERHLNRLFAREGTSLMRYVWERRLERCRRNLSDSAMRRRSIGELAFAAGFNDLSHFSRAYRQRYGCGPRETRRAGMVHESIAFPAVSSWAE